ncbi:MAG: GNAT family N-acetyltransferase, partial [Vicinamibacterales bacterium]
MAEPSKPRWKIEPFDKAVHDRSQFDCGNATLNDWLQKRVSQFERRDLARTYVAVEEGDPLVRGYYALSNHTVVYEALTDEEARNLPSIDVPVVLLGRLATDRSTQGQGLGELLLMDALRRAEYLSHHIGVRAVEVHATGEAAKRFYLRYGFIPLEDDP